MKANVPIILSLLALIFSSCRKFEQEKIVARAEPFTPTNLYPVERLPTYMNRVVVLPCFHADPDSPLLAYIDDVFHQELAQERIFETIRLSTADMKGLFGSHRISSFSELPENFLRILDEQTGASGVLFIDLDSYRPYRPMSLGVRAKLVDLKSGEFMWAIDETFDTGHAGVIVGASLFQEKAQVRALSSKTSGSVLQSHRIFSKYIASTIFSTLPMR
tara:strand:- start:427 stop:1080 length:654 start_codon:yes stop_codon:yes gene_type:complete